MALIVLGLGWVIGLAPVGAWSSPWWTGAAWMAAGTPALLIAGPLKGRWKLVAGAAVAALISGALLGRALNTSAPEWASLLGEDVTLTGIVDSEPDRGETVTSYVLRVESMEVDGAMYGGGKVLVRFNQYDRYLPGDRVTVSGNLEEPGTFDSFDYRTYLARRGIYGTMFRPGVVSVDIGGASLSRWLTSRRLELDRSLQRSLPEPESSLAAGIAFGRDDGLSDESKADFNRAGLRHLVAVSGSNVTLVAALMYFLAIPVVGRRWAWIPAALSLAAYLGAAGLAPSVLRSGLMAGIFLAGSVVGRPQSGLPALFAAIIGMTAFHPSLAVDAGFLLSATATAGIIAFSPRVFAAVQFVTARGRLPAPIWVCQAIALTLSATVSTLPIMWVTFGRISLVSPLANLVVEPFFVLAFWASVAAAVLGMISQPLGAVAGIVAFYPLHFIVWSAKTFAGLPGASLDAPAGSATAGVVSLAVLTGFALLAYRYPARTSEESATVRNRRKSGNRFVIGAAATTSLFLVLPAAWAAHQGPSGFSVRFFDVGQGDGALVTTPHGKQIVIDAGPSGLGIARNLSEAMPPWDRSIDLLILSHPQEDHMAGFVEVAERYRIGSVVDNGNANTTATFGYFDSVLPSRRAFSQGDSIVVDGVRLDVLWPPASYVNAELNDTSLVIRVTYGQTSFLFTGDSEAPVHEALEASTDLSATVLKVPHHGSKTTDPGLFPAVHPALAVISVGANNIFGHPHPDTLHALGAIPVFRTDERGTITVRSDGSTIRVSTER